MPIGVATHGYFCYVREAEMRECLIDYQNNCRIIFNTTSHHKEAKSSSPEKKEWLLLALQGKVILFKFS